MKKIDEIQFFTPTEEVDLCGHATIGTFSALFQLKKIKPGNYTQETKAGILGVSVDNSGMIFMQQSKPKFYQILSKSEIADTLNISSSELLTNLPVQIVSTGLKDILVPVKSKEILMDIKPDFAAVSRISKKYNTVGYHIFSLSENPSLTAFCRNLAPLYDIPEEAATGTSNGALGCYLLEHQIITANKAKCLIFRQGEAMNRLSDIEVRISYKNGDFKKVWVGGKGLNLNKKIVKFR